MTKTAFVAWLRQPTTVHALGALALGTVTAAAHFLGANQDVALGLGGLAYVLTHAGINDSSSSRSIEKLIEDGVQAYVQRNVAAALPTLLADAQNIAISFQPAAPAPETPAATQPASPTVAPQPAPETPVTTNTGV